jgi:hypothetical protein
VVFGKELFRHCSVLVQSRAGFEVVADLTLDRHILQEIVRKKL